MGKIVVPWPLRFYESHMIADGMILMALNTTFIFIFLRFWHKDQQYRHQAPMRSFQADNDAFRVEGNVCPENIPDSRIEYTLSHMF